MIIGKIVAGGLGLMMGGFIGAVLGLYVGHQFDKGLGGFINPITNEQRERINDSFLETLFTLLGHVAKSDSRISKVEIAQAEGLMGKMGLTTAHRREAIRLFQAGASADFSLDATMASFIRVCGRHSSLQRSLLNDLISLALADGELHEAEQRVLRAVARHLGFSPALFDKLIEMILAQSQFRGSGAGSTGPASAEQLAAAYKALGVGASDSDAEIKKAYRKLISENHPDKLIGRGMPEDMVKLATERTQEIQTAYELIVARRK
ncbi:co-chaperone DjlA [Porticoccaceae bacterium]|nr:co-chaperone DjlA [Porticoccaceae bacterium]